MNNIASIHLLQMFDVVLARKFNKTFNKKISKLLTNECLLRNNSFAGAIRECAISPLVQSWNEACSVSNCLTAAKKTRTFPFNMDEVITSPFVHELNEEEAKFCKKSVKIIV